MSIDAVLWDLDGTLVDSLPDIRRVLNHTRRAWDLPEFAMETVRPWVGEGARQLLRRAWEHDQPSPDAALLQRLYEHFLGEYAVDPVQLSAPYAGIDALVRALPLRQAVVTNKPGAIARSVVAQLQWDRVFSPVIGSDDGHGRKPDPGGVAAALKQLGSSVDAAVFVGDSPIDIETARAAGLRVVAVSWGLRPRDELLGADAVVDDVAQLGLLLSTWAAS